MFQRPTSSAPVLGHLSHRDLWLTHGATSYSNPPKTRVDIFALFVHRLKAEMNSSQIETGAGRKALII